MGSQVQVLKGGCKKVALAALFYFMHYLYILYSESSDIYYVGQSHDPWERFTHHSTDENDSFTSKHAQLARGMYVVRFKGDDGSAHMASMVLE